MHDDFDLWNEDIQQDLDPRDIQQTVTYTRAWTVQTILSQIDQNNIELNPDFQRRNAWNDDKRARLIESLILNIPVPEIILAERELNSKKYLVLDGKQRLQAILGYIEPSHDLWTTPKPRDLKVETRLNKRTWSDVTSDTSANDIVRRLMNADIRCTVISNVKNNDILYDIFFRLNSGSVPLSSQELRHSIYHGSYSNYISEWTSKRNSFQTLLNIDSPDKRLRDAELLHRTILFWTMPEQYNGNLKKFLDHGMAYFNNNWNDHADRIKGIVAEIDLACEKLLNGLGRKAGRKFSNGAWETRFNKALFEAEIYYLNFVPEDLISEKAKDLESALERLMDEDGEFVQTIESTTKTVERYRTRFAKMSETIGFVFDLNNLRNPFEQ